MVKRKHKNNVIEKIQRINILKGVLIKNGNKERIFKYIFHIFKNLKETKNVPVSLRKNPIKMLEEALYKSAPFFAYKRLVKSGKLYEIPVPVSKKRATFIASSWIQKIAKKRTNEGNPFHYFIAKEIENILQKKGGALEQFHLYTAEGLEKNIFKKFVRKKYPTVSRSKTQNAYKAMLSRINRAEKRKKFAKKNNFGLYNIMQIKKKHKARDYRYRQKIIKKNLKKKVNYNKVNQNPYRKKMKSKKKSHGKK